jgi:hypothetical protein
MSAVDQPAEIALEAVDFRGGEARQMSLQCAPQRRPDLGNQAFARPLVSRSRVTSPFSCSRSSGMGLGHALRFDDAGPGGAERPLPVPRRSSYGSRRVNLSGCRPLLDIERVAGHITLRELLPRRY